MGNKLKKSLAWLTMALMLTSQVNVVLATTYEDGSTKYIDNKESSLNVWDAIYELEELSDTDDEIAEFSAPTTLGVRNVGANTLNLNIDTSSKGGLNTDIGGNNKTEQGQPKTATSKIYEFKGVTDEELKADHRYGRPVNYKDPTHLASDFLELRLMMEKTFESPATPNGLSGILTRGYFNGELGTVTNGSIRYSRSIFNTGINKLIENNKEALAKIAAETFADIDGTESYAHMIPVAIYYNLYDNITFETVQADNPQLGYKKGDVLFNGEKEISYAEAAVTLGNYDGVHKKFFGNLPKIHEGQWYTNDLGKLHDPYFEFIVTQNKLNDKIPKGFFSENFVSATGAIAENSVMADKMIAGDTTYASKDTKKWVEWTGDVDYVTYMQNVLDNPSQGCPAGFDIDLATLKKLGLKVEDANGNTNWDKGITRATVLEWCQQISEIDTGGFPSHLIER